MSVLIVSSEQRAVTDPLVIIASVNTFIAVWDLCA